MSNIACLDHPQGLVIVSELPQTSRRESVEGKGGVRRRVLSPIPTLYLTGCTGSGHAGRQKNCLWHRGAKDYPWNHGSSVFFLAAALQERLGCSQQASHLYIIKWDIGLF